MYQLVHIYMRRWAAAGKLRGEHSRRICLTKSGGEFSLKDLWYNSPPDKASGKFTAMRSEQIPQRRRTRILRSLEAANSPTLPLSPTTASPLLHHSFTPRVFRQLHYCKAANSPTLPLQRLHYRFTIASRDRFCRSFTTALGSFWLKLIHCPIL